MNKTDAFKILKLSLGSSLAIFIASLFKLQYATVAGIITLLVVKDTKKETLSGAFGKLFGFLLCTLYAFICFQFLGYSLFSFFIYTLILITTCFILKIRYVIPMCVVIASHYLLQESMSIQLIINETALFIIGASIGIIINMFMPSNIEKIYIGQEKLQKEVSGILRDLAKIILDPTQGSNFESDLEVLNNLINSSISAAYENINNNLLTDTQFFLEHMEIIKIQRNILKNLYQLARQLTSVPKQAYIVSNFIEKIGNTSFDAFTVNLLLDDLEVIISTMKNQPLPTDRDEFENRAILYLCLIELNKFLINRKNAQALRDNYYYNAA